MRTHIKTPAYLAIGSNLGDRESHLRKALAMLIETPHVEVRRISSFFDNPAQGGPENSPDFLNAAVELQTTLAAPALMKRLLEIEKAIGRERKSKWEPRQIDMDLLLYGISIVSSDELIVPHPLMHERKFVLKPLAEIAPNAIHPALQMTVAALLERVNQSRQPAPT
jgi:2-amino-4-hydroxy-6-hydroxymethyldihydropteridine diphosphokinase